MTIPNEAVQAAVKALSEKLQYFGNNANQVANEMAQAALTAAAPFLQGVKQEPVAWSIIFSDHYGVNCDTTFKTKQAAEKYVSLCERGKIVPLYLEPSPRAQALEEAATHLDDEATMSIARSETCSDDMVDEFCDRAEYFKEAADIVRALSSQPVADHADAGKMVADGWLPIDTAPKDGTPFLVFVPDDKFSAGTGIDVIWYDEEQWLFGSNTPFTPANKPTHWRPLPASPEVSG
ncbi:hypothetical protein H9643_19060 [Ochrobactrum sp. Sa2BUA5]|nr:hypothetical protein [Ochrobactrum gallinarum]